MPSPLHTSRQRAFLAAHVFLGILTTFFVVARFTAKRMKRLGLTVDDYLLLAALVSGKWLRGSDLPLIYVSSSSCIP